MEGAGWSAGGFRSSSAIAGCRSHTHLSPKGGLRRESNTRDETDGRPQSPESKVENSGSSLPELERVSPDKSAKTFKVGEGVITHLKWAGSKNVIFTYRCLERRPSRNGTGSRTRCRISGQKHTGNISRVSVRSCVDQAIATVWRRPRGGNLYARRPGAQTHRKMSHFISQPLNYSDAGLKKK